MTPQSVERPISMTEDELIETVARAIQQSERDNGKHLAGFDCLGPQRQAHLRMAARAAIEASGLLKERDEARNRVERLEAERDALSFELKQCSATMGRLQGLLVRYGDKVRMGTAARMEDQQVIDEAFQARSALTEKHNG
jgi:hypothetical protein